MYKPRIAFILNVFVFKKVKPMYFYALGFSTSNLEAKMKVDDFIRRVQPLMGLLFLNSYYVNRMIMALNMKSKIVKTLF